MESSTPTISAYCPHSITFKTKLTIDQNYSRFQPSPFRNHIACQLLSSIKWGCCIGIHHPAPIVDHLTAYRLAQQKIYSIRGTDATDAAAQVVYQKHGSRNRRDRNPLPARKSKSDSPVQLSLFDFLDEEQRRIAGNSR